MHLNADRFSNTPRCHNEAQIVVKPPLWWFIKLYSIEAAIQYLSVNSQTAF